MLSRPNELLKEHQNKVLNKYKILKNEDSLNLMIDAITSKNLLLKGFQDTIKDFCHYSVYMHDEGKRNPYFQKYIGNTEFSGYIINSNLDKAHSTVSAIAYICFMYNKYIKNIKTDRRVLGKTKKYLMDIVLSLAYNINKHHSNLDDLDKNIFANNLYNYYTNNIDKFEYIEIDNIEEILNLYASKVYNIESYEFEYYLLFKYMYSLLVASDYISVYEFNNKKEFEINRYNKDDIARCNDKLNSNAIISSINEYRKTKETLLEVNKYRSDMFIESEANLMNNLDNNIFFLEAATGSGKSLASLNLALKLLTKKNNKIVYVTPLNSIGEQTYDIVKDIISVKDKDVVLINSNEEVALSDFENYDKDFLDNQMLNYNFSLISSVKLFSIFFSNKKSDNMMLPFLTNSIIVIDEVQNYKNNLWIHFANAISKYSEILNIKIIIMSATLPKINKLMKDDSRCVSLIKNKDYYYNFFKTRCVADYSLLNKVKNTTKEVLDKIDDLICNTDRHRVLISTITTKTCEEFYNSLTRYETDGFLVFKMMGSTNRNNRQYIINKIQEKDSSGYKNKKVILVGTCLEAGIDIDMNIGFKDISILDSDEQFCGRIERNFKNVGVCYFYDLDDIDYIYKGDYRTENNLCCEELRECYDNKDFESFYNRNFNWLLNRENDNYNEYLNDMQQLNYKKVNDTMRLIDNKNYTFVFNCKYKDEDKIINCRDLIKEYDCIKEDFSMSYAEKQIKLKSINKQLKNFTYSINAFKFKEDILLEKLNNAYLVDDYKPFFEKTTDGCLTKESVFDLNKFVQSVNLFI